MSEPSHSDSSGHERADADAPTLRSLATVAPLPLVEGEPPEPPEDEEPYDDGVGELWTLLEDRPEQDRILIEQAYLFARKAHKPQKRKSGQPYIVHPVAVSIILARLGIDTVSIIAGLLHDTVEDVDWVTLDMLEAKFGSEVAKVVEGETKLSKLSKRGSQQAEVADEGRDTHAENLRQMLIAMLEDPRVILVKLADRLHNMRTMSSMPPEKQQRISRETMEIFAPIAHRLGIGHIKWELEDLSFRYLYPQEYEELRKRLNNKQEEREAVIQAASHQLSNALKDDLELSSWVSDIQISGRSKHLWSIYNKMQKEGKTLEQIFDLLAVRVVLAASPIAAAEGVSQERIDEAQDRKEKRICYHALSIVHSLWTPLPGRFKDYIAIPKSNGYQSLHTTMISPAGQPIEVQIRSQRMHEIAEFGFAAHWMYKAGRIQPKKKGELQFFSQAREMKDAIKDPSDYLDALKNDFLSGRVVVFSPKGEALSLAKGSTALDFAFHVHTSLGSTAIGARVNGRMVPLSHRLRFGDMIEILTSKQSKPSADWYQWVATRSARAKIRHYLRQQEREESLEKGRTSLERYLRKHNMPSKKLMRTELLEAAAQKLLARSNPDELYVALASGKVSPAAVAKILNPDLQRQVPVKKKAPQPAQASGVYIEGMTAPTKFSLCCSPWRGDQIMGYMTRGRGVSIHRIDCPNMLRLLIEEPERCVAASWTATSEDHYDVLLDIIAENRDGLLSDALQVLIQNKISPNRVEAGVQSDGLAHIYLGVPVRDQHELQGLREQLAQIKDVQKVHRIERIPRVNKTKEAKQAGGDASPETEQ